MAEADRARLRVESPRCPYCHEAVAGGEAQLACNECRAWHHEACWREVGRCAACGGTATGLSPAGGPAPPAPPTRALPALDAPTYRDRRGRAYRYRIPLGTWVLGKGLIVALAVGAIVVLANLSLGGGWEGAGLGIPGVIVAAALALRRFETWSRSYDPE